MTPRTPAELALLYRRLGSDLLLSFAGPGGMFSDGDLAATPPGTAPVDLGVASGVAQARQMLVNRLLTRRGELAPLGQPDYGSRHHELIGEPNTDRTRNLVKLYVLAALAREPRVASVDRCAVVAQARPRDVVRIELTVRLVESASPLNLVVPFELEGAP